MMRGSSEHLCAFVTGSLIPLQNRGSRRWVQMSMKSESVKGTTLRKFGVERGWNSELSEVVGAIKECVVFTASRVRRAGIDSLLGSSGGSVNTTGDEQKALDLVANDIFVENLLQCPAVSVLATEEEETEIINPNVEKGYSVVFDPLDGSSNIAACIPTGSIFGIYKAESREVDQVLQQGTQLKLAGYCLYSAATILVLSDGDGTFGFTYDEEKGDFILTHPVIRIPDRGQSYSVNDGRYHDWPQGLQKYITDIKTGRGETKTKYDTCYICSLVADVHYVLFRGGVAMNPRDHLRLVYEGNPIAFIVENANGKASNGIGRILEVPPEKLHHRLPLFVGSRLDIEELESYEEKGGVRQLKNPGYKY